MTEAAERDWWESRRGRYNVVLFSSAIVGFGMFMAIMALPGMLEAGEDSVEPMGLLCGAIVLPALANACYSLGRPVSNHLSRTMPGRDWAVILYTLGIAFTVFVFSVPALVSGITWLVKR